jgi:hypothetical protein
MITRHACVRVSKQALPLMARGHVLHQITNKVTVYSEQYKSVLVYQDQDQLYNSIAMHKDADIFHVHNEPNYMVTAVKEVFPDKPVVMDVHDSHLLRRNGDEIKDFSRFRVSADERNNLQLADGLVYVCEPMAEIVGTEFKLSQPSIVLPSFVPVRFYRIDFERWLGGLCYEGRIDTADELDAKWDFFQYSNYLPLAEKCNEIKMDFHIYTPRSNAKVREEYEKVCYLHEPVALHKLCKKMGRHDWGIVGNLNHHEEWKHALPNKLFEYMAACMPVVALNADECARFIREYKVGIVVESIEELAENWARHRELRQNVIKWRKEFVMENHIEKLERLYEGLAGKLQ